MLDDMVHVDEIEVLKGKRCRMQGADLNGASAYLTGGGCRQRVQIQPYCFPPEVAKRSQADTLAGSNLKAACRRSGGQPSPSTRPNRARRRRGGTRASNRPSNTHAKGLPAGLPPSAARRMLRRISLRRPDRRSGADGRVGSALVK